MITSPTFDLPDWAEQILNLRMDNAAEPLGIPTYDGSGVLLHPDVRRHGEHVYLMAEPYPGNDWRLENPCLYRSSDGIAFAPVDGHYPIITREELGRFNLADGDFVFHEDRLLATWIGGEWLGQGSMEEPGPAATEVYLLDGDYVYSLFQESVALCPAICFSGESLRLYWVHIQHCDAETSTVICADLDLQRHQVFNRRVCFFSGLPADQVIWHIDVKQLSSRTGEGLGYLALVVVYPRGLGCGSTTLYAAYSEDGIHWQTGSEPIIAPRLGNWDSAQIYRSSAMIEEGILKLYYSADDGSLNYGIGLTSSPVSDSILMP